MENYLSSYNFKPVLKCFLKFLVREGVYFSFFKELEYRTKTGWLEFNRINREVCTEPIEAINLAFNWSSTEEGSSYWGEIDLKWREKYKKIKKNENT